MDVSPTTLGVIVALIISAVVLWWFFNKKRTSKVEPAAASDELPIIYGSLGCPYTVKQMEKYPKHKFVDCTSEKCPEFVTAYPTTKFSDGKIEVGFS